MSELSFNDSERLAKVIDAMQEMIANAAATGVSLHIVHVNSMSLGALPVILELIDSARKRGLDITTEAYPYTAASTNLESTMFDDGWQKRLSISFGDLQWVKTGERLTPETFTRHRQEGGQIAIQQARVADHVHDALDQTEAATIDLRLCN